MRQTRAHFLHLVDISQSVVDAWEAAFRDFPEVEIACGNILEIAKVSVVSPANSQGFMDGGVDRVYTEFFGLKPQTELQSAIAERHAGELAVGASVVVPTGHDRIPYMICAPTMATPGPVPTTNAFYAMSAVLFAVTRHQELLREVYCPGLCTDVGEVEPADAAEEMAYAYKKWKQRYAD